MLSNESRLSLIHPLVCERVAWHGLILLWRLIEQSWHVVLFDLGFLVDDLGASDLLVFIDDFI